MSFRSSEGAQWRDAEAAKAKRAAYLVLQANGRYTVSTTGPADAFFGSNLNTRVKIDPTATSHHPDTRLVKVGDRFRAFGVGEQSPTLVSDNFNRTDSTTSLGSALTGQAWTALSGTWGIIGNEAYSPTISTHCFASIEAGEANVEVSATFPLGGIAAQASVAARLSDAQNGIILRADSGAVRLYRYEAFLFNQIGADFNGVSAGDVLKLRCDGNTLTAYRNGVVLFSVTEAFNSAVTKHGLHTYTDGTTQRFDNFLVERL